MDTILTYLNGGAAVVVVFGLCLLFHEAGHFALAKLFNMEVEEFAFGFGRALWQRRSGETLYRFNLLPVGGYVKIAGMEPGAENVARGFHSRPRWQGALVIVAGCTANVLLAILLFTAVTAWQGIPDPEDKGIYVAKVSAGAPAQQAGLQRGDRLVAVDGERYSLEIIAVEAGPGQQAGLTKNLIIERVGQYEVYTPQDMLGALRQAPDPVTVTLIDLTATSLANQQKKLNLPVPPALRQATNLPPEQLLQEAYRVRFDQLTQSALVGYIAARPARQVTLAVERHGVERQVQPTTEVTQGRYVARNDEGMIYSRFRKIGRIGVVLRGGTRPVGAAEAVKIGAVRMVGSVATVILSVQAIAQKQVEPELAGPVAIMAISVERARIGWDAVLGWAGIISSILAVANLFPFPPFDGFKIVLLGYEGIIRRRIDARTEWILSIAGFVVVIFLLVVLTFKDTANLIMHGSP